MYPRNPSSEPLARRLRRPGGPRARVRGWTGTTLFELLVVVLVLAVAAAVVIPRVSGTSQLRCRAAARLIMSDLEYAQNHAIVAQEPVTVSFDVSGNSYSLSNASGALIHPITKDAFVVDFDTIGGFDGVSVVSASFAGSSAVAFDALGAPDNGGTVRVRCGSDAYEITVAPVTGRVTVAQVP